MDNKKIGKLIAKLRNEKGLTQQMLGDKVGVGFRAVSKWERGITMPDIGIINELSKILGISSDELLSGELKEPEKIPKENNKISLKLKITTSVIISIILIFISILTYFNNKTYTYSMVSANDTEYNVRGQVTLQGNNISIILNNLYFVDEEFSSTIITNYEYYIYLGDEFIFNYGYNPEGTYIEERQSINEFEKSFRINYSSNISISRRQVLKNKLYIELRFLETKK